MGTARRDRSVKKAICISESPGRTLELGEALASRLKPGDVVALSGELGAGKTVFAKGIARGLGVKDVRYVNSPTFVVIKEYRGRIPMYHFDMYRVDRPSALDSENYEEYFYGDGVCVVEWAEKVGHLLPKGCVKVKLSVLGQDSRRIEIG